jgi:tetratricopeptide (TPR) repeat protein
LGIATVLDQSYWDDLWNTLQRQPTSVGPVDITFEDLWEQEKWSELVPLVVRELIRSVRSGDLEDEADHLLGLGLLMGHLELFNEGSVVLRRALGLLNQFGERTEIATCASALAWHLAHSSDPSEAIPAYREAIAVHLELNRLDEAFLDLARLGALLSGLGRWAEALECFEEVYPIAPNREWVCWGRTTILQSMSEAYQGLGDLPRAIWFQCEAIDSLLQNGEKTAAAECSIRLGELHALDGRPADGRGVIMNAIMVLESLGEEGVAARATGVLWDMD